MKLNKTLNSAPGKDSCARDKELREESRAMTEKDFIVLCFSGSGGFL
jgi:hypothetical protein